MRGIPAFAAEARRAATRDVGQNAALKQLAQLVEAASDDDLGTLVVAHAVLTHAADQRAAEVAGEKAAAEERRRAAARQARQAQQAAIERRRSARVSRLRQQLVPRLILSAVYSALIGYFITQIDQGSFMERAVPLFAVCAVTVAGTLLFDWFAYSSGSGLPSSDPEGRLRKWCVGAGGMVGTAPWLRFLSEWGANGYPDLGPSVSVGQFVTSWTAVTLPLALACGWIIGGMITVAVGSNPDPTHGSRIERTQRYLVPVSWLGPVSAASACLLFNWSQLAYWLIGGLGTPQVIPQWNPFLLWSHPVWLIILGTSAMVLHHAATPVSGRAVWLGYAAAYLGALLGLLSLVTNPGHIVTWLLDWAVRSFS